MDQPPSIPGTPAARWDEISSQVSALREEIGRTVVGQDVVVEQMLTSLFCGGHCLVVGVPGLAKTLLVSTLGKVLGLDFNRIQFTPDLMPTDILGSEILQEGGGGRRFEFTEGPVFANLILADEINRTPPKTQAALLEAMQERQVTVSGKTRELPSPFAVFATQNPIEQEGTYPLPEAQLDRFFFNLKIDYPTLADERAIVERTTGRGAPLIKAVTDAAGVLAIQDAVHDVPLPDHVLDKILALTHGSRPGGEDEFINNYVAWGAGPRASQSLAKAARGLALLRGQPTASEAEVAAVAAPVLRHRVITNYNATGEGLDSEDVVTHLLKKAGLSSE